MPKVDEVKLQSETDLYYLSKDILGYKDLEHEPHVEFCDYLDGPDTRKLVLLPRGTFKTTIGTISRSIKELINDPDIRILIWSETFAQSKKFLSEIKQQLERNEKLIGLYGVFRKEVGWREDEITIRQRTKIFKEPTITCGGVDVTRVGWHFDLIIVDDPHSQKNVNTAEQIAKVHEGFRLLFPMLEPGGELCVIATRWHYADLSSILIEDGRFSLMIKQAEWLDSKGERHYYFKKRLTPKYLRSQREELGGYLYSCQYLNNPVDDENADFQRTWFKYFKEDELDRLELATFITIDPGGYEEGNDYTGIIINSVDINKNWYLRRTMKLLIKGPELIKMMFMWAAEFPSLVMFGVEKEKYSLAIQPFLEEEMERQNIFLPIELLTPKISNKELRIRGLAPRYKAGKIYHSKKDLMYSDLEEELVRFPKSKFDDMSDALSMQLDIAKAPYSAADTDYTPKLPKVSRNPLKHLRK